MLHVVFSTKGRQPLIRAEIAERLYPYIGGIVRAERGVLIGIGGVEDHVHPYLRWRPDGAISDLMRTVEIKIEQMAAHHLSVARELRLTRGLQRVLRQQIPGKTR